MQIQCCWLICMTWRGQEPLINLMSQPVVCEQWINICSLRSLHTRGGSWFARCICHYYPVLEPAINLADKAIQNPCTSNWDSGRWMLLPPFAPEPGNLPAHAPWTSLSLSAWQKSIFPTMRTSILNPRLVLSNAGLGYNFII